MDVDGRSNPVRRTEMIAMTFVEDLDEFENGAKTVVNSDWSLLKRVCRLCKIRLAVDTVRVSYTNST